VTGHVINKQTRLKIISVIQFKTYFKYHLGSPQYN
jgi:hypothetical protein